MKKQIKQFYIEFIDGKHMLVSGFDLGLRLADNTPAVVLVGDNHETLRVFNWSHIKYYSEHIQPV